MRTISRSGSASFGCDLLFAGADEGSPWRTAHKIEIIFVGNRSQLLNNPEVEELLGPDIVQYWGGHEDHMHVRLAPVGCSK